MAHALKDDILASYIIGKIFCWKIIKYDELSKDRMGQNWKLCSIYDEIKITLKNVGSCYIIVIGDFVALVLIVILGM